MGSPGALSATRRVGPVGSQIAESTEADNLAKLSQEGAVARVVVDIPVGGDKHLPVGTEAYAVDWAGNAEAAGEDETGEAGCSRRVPLRRERRAYCQAANRVAALRVSPKSEQNGRQTNDGHFQHAIHDLQLGG